MAAISGSAETQTRLGEVIYALNPSIAAAWTCNVAAWIALIAQIQEPLTVLLAVMTGWCAFEGLRLRSFPLVIVSLINTWWLLA
jgi:hypothetical protein